MKHDSLSLQKDLEAFRNITAGRLALFNAASDEPVKAPAGVNALAEELHPDLLRLTVSGKTENADGTLTLTLQSDAEKLPFFRAGQYINILCGENIYPFFLSSSPAEALKGKYEICVEKENAAYGFLSALKEGASLVSGAPMGYFYHQPLRDGVSSAVIADSTGRGAALSMRNNEKTDIFLCESTHSVPAAEKINADTVFICGRKEFCKKAEEIFSGRHVRVLYTDAPVKNTPREKYVCTVICGDDTFSFDCFSDEPLMTALEKNGVRLFNKCRTGDCAFCRARLISGTVSHAFDGENDARRKADIQYGYIHPCRAFPESDVTLKY